MGHIITPEEIRHDSEKVSAIKNWPTPSTIKQVRSFLGLTGYYRWFINRYAQLAAPITNLLKKNNFHWNWEVKLAFIDLKNILITAQPSLGLSKFQAAICNGDRCVRRRGGSRVAFGRASSGFLQQEAIPSSPESFHICKRTLGRYRFCLEVEALPPRKYVYYSN